MARLSKSDLAQMGETYFESLEQKRLLEVAKNLYELAVEQLEKLEQPASSEKIDTRSTAEHLSNIRDVFAINMSDLAIVLEATRPTVYAWLDGQEPKKPEAVQHIQQLSRTADVFGQANIQRLDKLLQRPILNGHSLLDLLKAKEDPLVALPSLKEISEKESRTRREPKGSGKHRRSLEDVLSESSVAIDLQG
jgi:DNA-binding transcriptional regulator YiaG